MATELSERGVIVHVPSTAGPLPEGWSWHQLQDVCNDIIDCPHSTPKLAETGPLMARSQDIRSGVFRSEQAACVTETTYQERIHRAEPTYGDLLYSREGTYFGIAAEVPRKARICLGQRMVLLRPDRRTVNFRYLRFWLNSDVMARHIHGLRDGTVAERLNMLSIRNLAVPVPPLKQQKAIAHILGTLDDKIELNRRMNETLEAMARAIFKSWFVDFDPVRAKMDGRQPPGMDAKTAALFPDGFEHQTGTLIPSGWSKRSMSGLVEVTKGRSYKSSELAESDTALVTLKSIQRGGGYRVDGLKPFTGAYKPDQEVLPGELVFSFTDVTQSADVIGKPAIVRSDERFTTLVASLDLGIIRPITRSISIAFLYCLLLNEDFQNHAYAHCSGTTVLHLSKNALPSYVFTVAPESITIAFAEFAAPMFKAIDENDRESRKLTVLRDMLLPKLLSGKLRLARAERAVGELL